MIGFLLLDVLWLLGSEERDARDLVDKEVEKQAADDQDDDRENADESEDDDECDDDGSRVARDDERRAVRVRADPVEPRVASASAVHEACSTGSALIWAQGST